MSMTTRNPTEVASCGCPYDPEYDEGSLGWHLLENHIAEQVAGLRRDVDAVVECLDVLAQSLRAKGIVPHVDA